MIVNNEISNKLRDFLYVLMHMMSSKSKSLQLYFKKTPIQIFCEYCDIFKNSFFIKRLRWLHLEFDSHKNNFGKWR